MKDGSSSNRDRPCRRDRFGALVTRLAMLAVLGGLAACADDEASDASSAADAGVDASDQELGGRSPIEDGGTDLAGDGGRDLGLAIETVEPRGVPFRDGGEVLVLGSGFADDAEVLVAGEAARVLSVSSTEIVAQLSPVDAGGQAPLTVRSGGRSATWTEFRYLGVPAERLRLVELRSSASLAPRGADWVGSLPTDGGAPRLLIANAEGLQVVLPSIDGAWREVGFARLPRADDGGAVIPGRGCVADFTGDGRADVWLADDEGASILVRGTEDDRLVAADAWTMVSPISSSACADADGDGVGDVLAVFHDDGDEWLGLLRGGAEGLSMPNGDLFPTLVGDVAGVAAIAVGGGADDAGPVDLVLGHHDAEPRWLVNDGAGVFADAPVDDAPPRGPTGTPHVGDLDDDGWSDLVFVSSDGVAAWFGSPRAFEDGSARYAFDLPETPSAVLVADVDVDGYDDLVVGLGDRLGFWRTDRAGRAFDYTRLAVALRAGAGRNHRIVSGDFDADGDPDFLVGASFGARYLRSWDPLPAEDEDRDGVPGPQDVCPDVSDPEQRDADARPFRCAGALDCREHTGCELEMISGRGPVLDCTGRAVSFADAASHCAAFGGTVAVPRGAEEEADLLGDLRVAVWIGAQDTATEGAFVDGAGVAIEYTRWAEGQPDDAGDGEDCVERRPPGDDGDASPGWNDLPCDRERGFVCTPIAVAAADETDGGDACDLCPRQRVFGDGDRDDDGVGDACDVCPDVPDPGQEDGDGDGVGDACAEGGGG